MPLYLRESDVELLLTATVAIDAVEAGLVRIDSGELRESAGVRLELESGLASSVLAVDTTREIAAGELSVAADEARRHVTLFDTETSEVLAVVEAQHLSILRASSLSAMACRLLATPNARTLGVIGSGALAEWQIKCIRQVLPAIDEVVVYSRTERTLAEFADRLAARTGDYYRDVAAQDVVVAATSSPDPVLRGEWLREGTLVCAAGATQVESREVDNEVVRRASFVCCDSKDRARAEAGDLVEPVERGVLDWLEVYELSEVATGTTSGRQRPEDIVLVKIAGSASLTLILAETVLTLAGERGLGTRV